MTTTCVADILEAVEVIAPSRLAEEWDNPGLQVGAGDWPAERVWVALDPAPEVVAAACDAGVHLLLTHHPLILRSLRRIDCGGQPGATIARALRNGLAICAAHTNLDSAAGGVNDVLADRLGLRDCNVLAGEAGEAGSEPDAGLGRVGELPHPATLAELGQTIKRSFELDSIRLCGDPAMKISKVAVCSGSGGGLVSRFIASDAQAFVSGDLRYHDGRDVQSAGKALIDIGHFASEHIVVPELARRLTEILSARGIPARVHAYTAERDPFRTG